MSPRDFVVFALANFLVVEIFADDWNQWMGPTRDGVYREAGIVESIPDRGLTVLWRVPVYGGYAGPAVANGRVYVLDYQRTSGEMIEEPDVKPKQQGIERLICFDSATGSRIWSHDYECQYEISYPAGPRATPTVVDGVVATIGAEGDLLVFEESSGKLIWSKNIPREFNVKTPVWGFASHPLVTESHVITMVGGEGQAVVAFDRMSGELAWKSLSSSDAGYCPPCIIDAGGVRQLIVWHPGAVCSLNPNDGSLYWEQAIKPDFGMSICRPMRDGSLLFVSGIENKSMMLRLDDRQPKVEKLWDGSRRTSLGACTSTPLLHDGIIFGCDDSLGALLGINAEDGKRLWQTWDPVRPGNQRRLSSGTVFITRHEPSGKYLLFGETGQFNIAEMNESGFRSCGRMQVIEPTQTAYGRSVVWSHPAYAGKTAFFRNDNELVAVSLSGDD